MSTRFQGHIALGPFDAAHRPVDTLAAVRYDVTPVSASATNLSAVAAVLAGASLILAAGAGVTTLVKRGVTRFVADIPRAVQIVSASNDSAHTFLVTGFDTFGVPTSELITGANAGTANGKKAFASITSISPSAATAGTVSAGFSDVIGLPWRVKNAGSLTGVSWSGNLARDTGTFVGADDTTATSVTGDPRGTYKPSTASNGALELVITALVNPDSVAALYGQTPA